MDVLKNLLNEIKYVLLIPKRFLMKVAINICLFLFSPSKVSKHPQAVRFFDTESVVTDWYRGQLGNALVAVNLADVSFIMYYAPWDAESQHVRSEFEKAANILSNRVITVNLLLVNFNIKF